MLCGMEYDMHNVVIIVRPIIIAALRSHLETLDTGEYLIVGLFLATAASPWRAKPHGGGSLPEQQWHRDVDFLNLRHEATYGIPVPALGDGTRMFEGTEATVTSMARYLRSGEKGRPLKMREGFSPDLSCIWASPVAGWLSAALFESVGTKMIAKMIIEEFGNSPCVLSTPVQAAGNTTFVPKKPLGTDTRPNQEHALWAASGMMVTRSADIMEDVSPKMQDFRDTLARNKLKRERRGETIAERDP